MNPGTVLITGANGFLGRHLARALVAHGRQVRCLVREASDAQSLAHRSLDIVRGDVTVPQSLGAALRGIDTVFHLAGIRRGTSRDEFLSVNAEGTRLVAEAAVAAGTRRLVLAGSLAASGPSLEGRARREGDALLPEEWYGESKAEAERIAFSFSARLEVTSCRPARILGPLDRENFTFFRLAAKGIVLRLGGPARHLSLVDVDDVVEQMCLQAERPEAIGEAFFCACDETATVESLMREAAAALRVTPRTIRVPPSLLRALGAVADVISNITGTRLPLNRKLARQLLAPGWTCSNDKARRVLGFSPRLTIKESIHRSAQSYVEAGWLPRH